MSEKIDYSKGVYDAKKLGTGRMFILGVQHMFAMFGATVLVPLLTGLSVSTTLLCAGLGTLLFHLITKKKVPAFLGSSFAYLGGFSIVAPMLADADGNLTVANTKMLPYACAAIAFSGLVYLVASLLISTFGIRRIMKFFPPVVTGTVVLSIGLSLISVGVNSFGGGNAAKDFGSVENLLLAVFVLVVILFFKHWTKGFLSSSSILVGIIAGYLAAIVMGFVLPTTGVTADGVEFTKAWVLNWNKVAEASWFAIPKLVPVKIVFDLRAILPVMIMFIVTAVETVGDISGVMEGGMSREATDKELSGGIICDGLGSTVAACFGVLPNTSFSQNVGLVAMTKVVNRGALATGAIFLMLCGLIPKLGALISIMPQAVLGGAAVMMFSSIVVSGIQLITKEKMTPRTLTIVSVALGVGYGMGANAKILANTPQFVQLICCRHLIADCVNLILQTHELLTQIVKNRNLFFLVQRIKLTDITDSARNIHDQSAII